MGLNGDKLKWYDSIAHTRMFALPKQVRALLANETRVMTVESPLFMQDSTINAGVFEKDESAKTE